ncbi:MAG TPA: hypothetical protein VIJ70_04185, partial [Gaiellaceae bacterium]
KDESKSAELDQVLYLLADGLRSVAVALSAYLPETAPKILEALGQPTEVDWELVRPGRFVVSGPIAAAPPLFPRLEAAAVDPS